MVFIILGSLLLVFFLGSMLLGWVFSAPGYEGPSFGSFRREEFP